MKLIIYKGFNEEFLEKVEYKPLVLCDIKDKINVLKFDRKRRKQLDIQLLSLEEDEEAWITYEEYSLIKNRVEDAVKEDGLKVVIYKNNLYPDYYPINFEIPNDIINEIYEHINSSVTDEISDVGNRFLSIYNSLVKVDEEYYGSFYNFEYEKSENIIVKSFYPSNIKIEESMDEVESVLFVNEDVDTYLRDLARIKKIDHEQLE